MRRAILVAAVLFALLAKPAVALTGNELRQWCNQQGDPIAEGFCLGYVVGVRDILPEDCVPQTVTNGQLVDVVRKYFEEAHPRVMRRALVVAVAFEARSQRHTYRCQRQVRLSVGKLSTLWGRSHDVFITSS